MPIDNLTDILFVQWQRTLHPFGVDQIPTENTFNNLVAAYSTPDRYYHTLKHIHRVLNTIKTLQDHTKDLTAVQLAAWFHDIVYDTQAKDNEEKSAEYADKLLIDLGIPPNKIAIVTRLILNTKHHQAEKDDVDSQVLLDADLAILSANPVEYWEYAKAIRQEYAWVPEAEYITGRSQVLERFLQCDRIYSTPLMFHLAEQPARYKYQHRNSDYFSMRIASIISHLSRIKSQKLLSPIPHSPIPNSQFPIPNSPFPIPHSNSPFPIPKKLLGLIST